MGNEESSSYLTIFKFNKDSASMFGSELYDHLNGPYVTHHHLGGIQYTDVLESMPPLLLVVVPLMFMKASRAPLLAFHAKCIIN
jgi:hypothetical protein